MRQYISLNHSHDLIYVKLLLAHHRFREAEKILQEQLAPAEEQKRIGSLIQWQSLHALLNQAQGRTEQAVSALAYALYLAEHRGYIRAFLDWGTPLRQLLQHLHTRLQKGDRPGKLVPTSGFTQQLLQLFSEDEQRHGNQKIELSKREIEVLKLLGKGRANRQIAEELVITASTVKSHLRAIYTKLGTESRTQALIEARKHGLL